MNKKKVLLPLLILAVGIGGFIALKATRPKPPVAQVKEPVWRVQVVPVRVATASPVLNLNGRVESPDQTQAAAPGVGRVLSVRVREGQAFSKGQLMVELDPRDFQPRVDQARGQVQELEAALASEHLRHKSDLDQLAQERRLQDFAAAEVARFERLQQENFFSQAAVDQGRSALSRQQISVRGRELAIADHQARLAQLQARLVQARANLDQAELALQRSRVTAPFSGYVAQVAVAVGDQVNTGQLLVRLYPAAGLEVRAKLPAPLQDEFLAGLVQGRHPLATARVGGETLNFRLARVAGAADARGLDGFFVLDKAAASLRLGELVSLYVARSPAAGVVGVPYSALFGGNRVYRIEGDRLKALDVEVLGEATSADAGPAAQSARLLVRSPALKDGDLLLATHLPNAISGLKVEVIKP
jgi:multidrug efflux pump subunit AcrA (membrane-fusion protein)